MSVLVHLRAGLRSQPTDSSATINSTAGAAVTVLSHSRLNAVPSPSASVVFTELISQSVRISVFLFSFIEIPLPESRRQPNSPTLVVADDCLTMAENAHHRHRASPAPGVPSAMHSYCIVSFLFVQLPTAPASLSAACEIDQNNALAPLHLDIAEPSIAQHRSLSPRPNRSYAFRFRLPKS